MIDLSKLIIEARKEMDISQYELARKAGVSRQTINSVESKGAKLSVENLERVLKVLGYQIVIKKEDRYEY